MHIGHLQPAKNVPRASCIIYPSFEHLLQLYKTAVRPNQRGFMTGRGFKGQIHNLRRTLEQRWSFQQAAVMCFVDFATAFDSVGNHSLRRIMATDGMPQTL